MIEADNPFEFLPGFTIFRGTKPGTIVQNDVYSIIFSEILLNGRKDDRVSRVFESCYDWADVMTILLDSLQDFLDISTSEDSVEKRLKSWFLTYPGWGLLSILLPRQTSTDLRNHMVNLKQAWPQERGEYTERACWELFREGKNLEEVVPQFDVTIGYFGPCERRQKLIKLEFTKVKVEPYKDSFLEVIFIAGKKEIEKDSLMTNSAAVIADHMKDTDDIDGLEIPRILRKSVADFMEDNRWVTESFHQNNFT